MDSSKTLIQSRWKIGAKKSRAEKVEKDRAAHLTKNHPLIGTLRD
jgi:hypothetical protein